VKPAVALLALGLFLALPSASAATDSYSTTQGHRATASYPDVANNGDNVFVVVNADPGTGQVNSFPTAPTGWTFVGCTFVSVDANQASTHRGQTVRLNMTDDTCSFYVEIVWSNAVGQQNAATTVRGTIVTDDQSQDLFHKEFVQPIAWLVWIVYLVLLYKVKQVPLRGVAVLVGFSIVLLPMPQLNAGILLAGQLAVAVVFLVQLIQDRT
jgi:hypothetical protein